MRSYYDEKEFMMLYPNSWLTIDSHTVGESTRVVIGYPRIPGGTILEKRQYLKEKDDRLRRLLTREPRGNREIIAVLVTEPVSPGAAFGLIYMDARRYPYLCGHGTMGALTTLLETGLLKVSGSQAGVRIDTPSGPVDAVAHLNGRKVESVSIRMVPSFVFALDQQLEVPGFGRVPVDLVFSGGFFAMVHKDAVGIELALENVPRLIPLGMEIIAAANQQLRVQHPLQKEINTVDVTEFYDLSDGEPLYSKGAVIYGESHIDRSPCGTGTSAKLALMHHKGELAEGELLVSAGMLETTFDARIVETKQVGPFPAVVGEIRGSAYLTGYHRFVLDSADPFPDGFLI